MQTRNWHGAVSVLSVALPGALAALLLYASAACGVDSTEDATASATQDLAGACTIQRPYAWSVGFNPCSEAPSNNRTLTLAAGSSATFFSGHVVGDGTGQITVMCHSNGDGRWDEQNATCVLAIDNQ